MSFLSVSHFQNSTHLPSSGPYWLNFKPDNKSLPFPGHLSGSFYLSATAESFTGKYKEGYLAGQIRLEFHQYMKLCQCQDQHSPLSNCRLSIRYCVDPSVCLSVWTQICFYVVSVHPSMLLSRKSILFPYDPRNFFQSAPLCKPSNCHRNDNLPFHVQRCIRRSI